VIIDGKSCAKHLNEELAIEVTQFTELYMRAPGLAVVLVGSDPASDIYVRSKVKACASVGIASFEHRLASSNENDLLKLIEYLNQSEHIDGILVQLPLPDSIDPKVVLEAIDPKKDVDGFHPYNAGRLAQRDPTLVPCTPMGVLHLLKEVRGEIRGLDVCVVGASNIVGRPMAQLLLIEGCTVTVVHRFTADSMEHAKRADIVIAAVGKAGLVTKDWIKPGATVIDVGINRVDGKIVGDCADDVREVAGAITPVPGGVGPMTIAMLLRNTLSAAEWR
jgi:methylenetetrahydrofolate dehydrogenase (NADP+) / methenyltetrahydrofolate cyclohydrolase